jgi:hypothetical protein
MKNIICILAIVSFLSGCDSNDRNSFLEKIGLGEKITEVIQIRKRYSQIWCTGDLI